TPLFRSPTLRDHLNSVSSFKAGPIWILCLAVITPIVLAYSLIMEIISLINEPYEGYETSVIGVWGWGMIGAILVLSVILSLLPWRGRRHLDGPPPEVDDPSDLGADPRITPAARDTAGSGTPDGSADTTEEA